MTATTTPLTCTDLSRHQDQHEIGNRMFFGGNLLRQLVLVQLRKDNPAAFRIVGELAGADRLMNESIFVGLYPGLTQTMLEYIVTVITEFVRHSPASKS